MLTTNFREAVASNHVTAFIAELASSLPRTLSYATVYCTRLCIMFVVAYCCTFPFNLSAQQTAVTGPMMYPAALESGDTKFAVEMALTKMPESVVEESDTYRWPSWTMDGWVGLPLDFSINGRLTTQFINWHLQVGPKWRLAILDPLTFHFGYDVGVFVGGLGSGAFDNGNVSSFVYPNMTIGWRSSTLAVSLKVELNYCLSKVDRAGTIIVRTSKNFPNGMTVGLFLEQPFWDNSNFELGMRGSVLKFAYQNWLLFPTIDRWYFIPELMMGVRL